MLNKYFICKVNFTLLLFNIVSLLCFSWIASAEETPLLELIKTDDLLISGNVGFVQLSGQQYVISVGRSPIKDNTPEAKLNAKKEAELNAQEGLTKFIYNVKVSSKEEFNTKTHVVTENGKVISREINESYLEIIREKGEGILKHITSIGKMEKCRW